MALRPYRLSNTDTRKDRLAAKRRVAVSGLKRWGGSMGVGQDVRRVHYCWREFTDRTTVDYVCVQEAQSCQECAAVQF